MNTNKKIWRGVSVLEQWIRAFWLVALVLGAGLTVFLPEVVQSIESTPHPALVYAIFGVAGSAVLLCAHALWCYVREESLLLQLQQTPPAQRLDTLNALSWRSDLAPACVALLDHPGEAQVQQAVVENELYVCEERLLSRLTLPAYLSGALVGLGLVGTFIGLLGALADLGGLFSSLTDMGEMTPIRWPCSPACSTSCRSRCAAWARLSSPRSTVCWVRWCWAWSFIRSRSRACRPSDRCTR